VEVEVDPIFHSICYNIFKFVIGARIRTTFDFGLVTLSINGVRPDDSGIYTCKATNQLGEAVSTCTVKVEGKNDPS
jgi:hypothetical protein